MQGRVLWFRRCGRLLRKNSGDILEHDCAAADRRFGGFPISGVIGKAEIMDAAGLGGLGGTYGAAPLGSAGGPAILDVFDGEQMCGQLPRDRTSRVARDIRY